jgi:hypothetical protein
MAQAFKNGLRDLLNEAGGTELRALITEIQDPAATANIGTNLPLIEAIQPALLVRGRAIAVESSMTYSEAIDIFSRDGYKAKHPVLERLFSPRDPAFDNLHSSGGITFFEAQLALHGNPAEIQRSTQILENCMSHLQTFVYPLRFTNYTAIGGPPLASSITYGPATSSKPDATAQGAGVTKYTARPEASYYKGFTAVDNMDMWQFPPNCLYQSQIKMREGYSEGTTFAVGFKTGDIMSENCIVKTFVLANNTGAPSREYPFDTSNIAGMPKGYTIYIRRSDSMAIFVDANGTAVREIPTSIVMKLPTTNRFNNDICNNFIGNYVGSMMAASMSVVNITSNDNTVNVAAAVYPPARVLGIAGGLPGNLYISDIDIRNQALNQINQPENLMALRMCARIAFWRYRVIKPASKGGSNKMMITNMSNKTRNMTKRQRRSKSKSKSKSKSMSMLKSAKRTFYRTNKRNKTSRRY